MYCRFIEEYLSQGFVVFEGICEEEGGNYCRLNIFF